MIGQRVRSQLFKEDDKVLGQRINIRNAEYLVVGIFKTDDDDDEGDEKGIIIPLRKKYMNGNSNTNRLAKQINIIVYVKDGSCC